MRALLLDFPEGVPRETLLTRIRGRRSHLVASWDRLILSPDPTRQLPPAPWRPDPGPGDERVWRALQGEYRWVFRWLPEPLRVEAAPFFWLAELRTIVICLRCRAGSSSIDELLQGSLMNRRLGTVLRTAPDTPSALRQLSQILAPHAPECAALASLRPGEVETALEDIFLERLAAGRLHPVMARYVALTIDCRNLYAVAKRLRWPGGRPPRLLGGGTIPARTLEELAARGDGGPLVRLAARLGGAGQSGDPGSLERTVLQARYRALTSLARDERGVGEIISYLCRCRNEARAIGLLSRLATAGADAFETEIVP